MLTVFDFCRRGSGKWSLRCSLLLVEVSDKSSVAGVMRAALASRNANLARAKTKIKK